MPASWPVARSYSGQNLARISLPVGGIGTGTVGFGGRGQFRDWELENHPAKGLTQPLTFLACRVAGPGVPASARILEGALLDEDVEGWQGSPAPLAGLPRFGSCEFQAGYPFGRVLLSDPGFPVHVAVTAVSPLVPGDAEASGLPLASLRVTLTSHADAPIDADVMFSVETLAGHSLRAAGLPSSPSVAARSQPGSGASALAAGILLSDAAMDPGTRSGGRWPPPRSETTPGQVLCGAWASGTRDCWPCGRGSRRPGSRRPVSSS